MKREIVREEAHVLLISPRDRFFVRCCDNEEDEPYHVTLHNRRCRMVGWIVGQGSAAHYAALKQAKSGLEELHQYADSGGSGNGDGRCWRGSCHGGDNGGRPPVRFAA